MLLQTGTTLQPAILTGGAKRRKMADSYISKVLPASHKDLIHDVAYDYYGRRMATCSSDQTVEVCVMELTLLCSLV